LIKRPSTADRTNLRSGSGKGRARGPAGAAHGRRGEGMRNALLYWITRSFARLAARNWRTALAPALLNLASHLAAFKPEPTCEI
jgi:hypothetical protein